MRAFVNAGEGITIKDAEYSLYTVKKHSRREFQITVGNEISMGTTVADEIASIYTDDDLLLSVRPFGTVKDGRPCPRNWFMV